MVFFFLGKKIKGYRQARASRVLALKNPTRESEKKAEERPPAI